MTVAVKTSRTTRRCEDCHANVRTKDASIRMTAGQEREPGGLTFQVSTDKEKCCRMLEEDFMITQYANQVADRWMQEQMFEEDVRAVLGMLRPNRQERIAGWSEYRTGGKHFRATISWDEEFELASENK